MKEQLEKEGYIILRNVIKQDWINYLRIYSETALEDKPEGFCAHAILEVEEFSIYLSHLIDIGVLDKFKEAYFESPFIINSFSIISNRPSKPNFSALTHRDIRFFSGKCNLMLNTLLFLDDFTKENGGTWILPGSHEYNGTIEEAEKSHKWIQLEGKAGDMAVWNSNLLHRSGKNTTLKDRRAIVTVYQKSALKQLIDYPEAMKDRDLPDNVKQLLGFDSIVPKSLEQWYGERTYKKGQD